MLNNWVDDLAKGLWEFNIKYGKWEDYRYQALKCIYKETDACSNSVISLETYHQYKTNYEKNIKSQKNFDSCN